MYYELVRIWKEVVVTYSRYYLGIFMGGNVSDTKNHRQDRKCRHKDSKRAPLKNRSKLLPLYESASGGTISENVEFTIENSICHAYLTAVKYRVAHEMIHYSIYLTTQ
jgi:hypothetical protein